MEGDVGQLQCPRDAIAILIYGEWAESVIPGRRNYMLIIRLVQEWATPFEIYTPSVQYLMKSATEGTCKGVTPVYLNTVIRWTRLTWQKSKWADSLYLYNNNHIYTCTWHKLGQYPTELLMTSLVCKVGLYYSSASINQLFNTKNSLLHLLSRKATLKCEVLFKSVN